MNTSVCIVLEVMGNGGFVAVNEDGRLICSRSALSSIQEELRYRGWDEVSLNSRVGKTILDKIDNKNNKFKPL